MRASFYSMGPQTLKVSSELFVLNRARLCDRLKKHGGVENNAIVLLQGGSLVNLYDTDVEYEFRQVSDLAHILAIFKKFTPRSSFIISAEFPRRILVGNLCLIFVLGSNNYGIVNYLCIRLIE